MISPTTRVRCPVCAGDRTAFERAVAGFALERCRDCGHVFMNPQYTAAEVEGLYRHRDVASLSGIYARIAASESVKQNYARRLDLIEGLVPGRGRLLDFACGAGAFFEMAQQRGWDAHGSELGEWAAEAAREKGLRNLHTGTLTSLNFGTASFDVVYAAQVFEHLPQPTIDLAEIRRILRPGGLLYLDVPNYRTLSIVLGRDDFMLNEPPQHLNYFSPKSLTRLLAAGGFGDIRLTTDSGLKWENLLGRSIKSEIKDAYGLGGATPAASTAKPAPAGAGGNVLKKALLATIVKPVLYDRLKVGMLLRGLATRP